MEQPRLEKEMMVMLMLSSMDRPTIEEIAKKVHSSTSTVYRYIRLFKEHGFAVEKKRRGVFQIVNMPKELADFQNLVYFTEEEAYIVNTMIAALDNGNMLKQNIMKKLAAIYKCSNLAEYAYRGEISRNISQLTQAIGKKRKVILHRYSSNHSHTVRDRLVEPYRFTPGFMEIWSFDLEEKECKTFKVSRIGEVEILDETWDNEKSHLNQGSDIFRIHGSDWEHVVLEMGIMAKNLLVEEFPLAQEHLKSRKGKWILDTEVCGSEGVGRFVLGMAADIRIIKGKKLRKYVGDYTREHLMGYMRDSGA